MEDNIAAGNSRYQDIARFDRKGLNEQFFSASEVLAATQHNKWSSCWSACLVCRLTLFKVRSEQELQTYLLQTHNEHPNSNQTKTLLLALCNLLLLGHCVLHFHL